MIASSCCTICTANLPPSCASLNRCYAASPESSGSFGRGSQVSLSSRSTCTSILPASRPSASTMVTSSSSTGRTRPLSSSISPACKSRPPSRSSRKRSTLIRSCVTSSKKVYFVRSRPNQKNKFPARRSPFRRKPHLHQSSSRAQSKSPLPSNSRSLVSRHPAKSKIRTP